MLPQENRVSTYNAKRGSKKSIQSDTFIHFPCVAQRYRGSAQRARGLKQNWRIFDKQSRLERARRYNSLWGEGLKRFHKLFGCKIRVNPSVTTWHLPYILHNKTPRKATGHGAAICKEYGDGTYGSVSWTKWESDLCHTLMSFFFKFIMINGNIQ